MCRFVIGFKNAQVEEDDDANDSTELDGHIVRESSRESESSTSLGSFWRRQLYALLWKIW